LISSLLDKKFCKTIKGGRASILNDIDPCCSLANIDECCPTICTDGVCV